MKKLAMWILPALFLLTCATGLKAEELRGLWVDAWHHGFKSPAETTEMVAKAKAYNFNTLFVQVRRRSDTYYRSSIEPTALDVAPDYDPLADVVAKAHAAGLKVHAWLAIYTVHHYKHKEIPGMVHLKHPDWLMKDVKGESKIAGGRYWLDPGVPEAREYVASLVEEIARKYSVDGIHLDRLEYPSREAGYNIKSLAAFFKETGSRSKPDKDDPKWCEWRTARTTDLVRAVYRKANTVKPGIQISASVNANLREARWHRLQDWEAWLKEGILDFAVPMSFFHEQDAFRANVEELLPLGKYRPIYIGQSGWDNPVTSSLEQIGIARKAGAKGIVIYNYYLCSRPGKDETTSLFDALKAGLFSHPDTVPDLHPEKTDAH